MSKKKELKKMAKRFKNLCKSYDQIFEIKNKQYDNTIIRTGVLGASIELIGVVARLRPLVLKMKRKRRLTPKNIASIKNVSVDTHNYANILRMMLEDRNWDGI